MREMSEKETKLKERRVYICACGETFFVREDYFKHRKTCEEYPWDETDKEMEDCNGDV